MSGSFQDSKVVVVEVLEGDTKWTGLYVDGVCRVPGGQFLNWPVST